MSKSFKIVGITDITIRRILQEASVEALGLYVAYFEIAQWQGTYRVKATTGFMTKRVGWGKDKVIKYKKQLLDIGVIEDYQDKNEEGKIKGHYVTIKHLVDENHTPENDTPQSENPEGGKATGWNSPIQVLSTSSLSTLNNNKVVEGQISEEKGNTPAKRLLWLYSSLWRKKYGTEFKVDSWAKYGVLTKKLLSNYNEVQAGALMCCMFNWYGASGGDQREHDFVEKAFYPFGLVLSQANKYETYLRNVERLDFDNVDQVKRFISSNLQ